MLDRGKTPASRDAPATLGSEKGEVRSEKGVLDRIKRIEERPRAGMLPLLWGSLRGGRCPRAGMWGLGGGEESQPRKGGEVPEPVASSMILLAELE